MTPEERKLAKSEYWQKWYSANKEEVLAKQKERGKRNYAANPDSYRERSKKWKQDNPEKYKEMTKRHRDENREIYKKRSADWYANNKDLAAKKGRTQKLKSYGLTQETFDQILESQNGTCAICGTDKWGNSTKNRPHIDHCHETGKVRGLLCHGCNVAIGILKDNPDTLMSAYNYLIKSQKEETI